MVNIKIKDEEINEFTKREMNQELSKSPKTSKLRETSVVIVNFQRVV